MTLYAKKDRAVISGLVVLSYQLKIDSTIFVTVQNILSRVAALGEVVWHIDRNDSTQPSHARDDNRIRPYSTAIRPRTLFSRAGIIKLP
jgi:hypothetical protein